MYCKNKPLNKTSSAPIEENQMVAMTASCLNSAVELTRLVVENRIRNNQKLTDEDIYTLYMQAFTAIMDMPNELCDA